MSCAGLRIVAALQAMQGEIKRLTEEVKALLKKHDAQAGLIMTIEQRVSCPPAVWAWPHMRVVAPGQCTSDSPDCWTYLGRVSSLHWRPQPGRVLMNDGCLRLSPDSVVTFGAAGWCHRPPQGHRFAAAGVHRLRCTACGCLHVLLGEGALLYAAVGSLDCHLGLLHGLSHECWEACRCLWTVLEAWHCVRQPQVQQS